MLLVGQAFNSVSCSRCMNVLTGVGTEKVKAKKTLKNQTSLFKQDLKELFGISFWKYLVVAAKANK